MPRVALSCVLAAFCAVVGDILFMATLAKQRNDSHRHINYSQYTALDPSKIQHDWELRRDLRALQSAAGLFNAISWVVLCVPLLQLAFALSLGGKRLVGLHTAIAVLSVTGAATEFASHVMLVGALMAMEWISDDFNLDFWMASRSAGPDYIGWRTLEVVYVSVEGLLMWVNALEWLFLGFILILLSVSIRRQQGGDSGFQFSGKFGWFSLFLSCICWVEFAFEVLRFKEWIKFTRFALFVSLASRFFFWPAWFFFLGRQLVLAANEGLTPKSTLGQNPMPEIEDYPKPTLDKTSPETSDIEAEDLDETEEDKPGLL